MMANRPTGARRAAGGEATLVWRERPFRLLAGSRTVSLVGDSAAPIALAFAVLALPGASPSSLGLVLVCRSAAQICCVLLGGVIADRFPRARVMIAANLLAGAAQAACAALVLSGGGSVASLAALAAANGATAAVILPASSALLPELVRPEMLKSANAVLRLGMNSSSIAGAALAGAVATRFSPGWVLGADALSFVLAALALTGIRTAGPPAAERRPGLLSELAHGWGEFSSRPWIWAVVAQFAVINACANAGLRVLGPALARAGHGGAGAWSAIMAGQAVGLLAGTFLLLRLHPRRPLRAGVLATCGFAPPFFLLAAGAPAWCTVASMVLSGICSDVFSVFWSTALQVHVPEAVLSRISGYDALGSYILGPIGLAAAGPLARVYGAGHVLAACGWLGLAATGAALLSKQVRALPAARRLDPPGTAARTRGGAQADVA